MHRDGTDLTFITQRVVYLHTEGESGDTCNTCHNIQEWHEILGHCNYEDVLKLQNVVEGMQIKGKEDRPDKECEVCIHLKEDRNPL